MAHVYLIQSGIFVKIGVTTSVARRLAGLETGNPSKLKVLAIYAFENARVVEKALHQKFALSHYRGEWFELGFDTIYEFHRACDALDGKLIEGDPSYYFYGIVQEGIDEKRVEYQVCVADGCVKAVKTFRTYDRR